MVAQPRFSRDQKKEIAQKIIETLPEIFLKKERIDSDTTSLKKANLNEICRTLLRTQDITLTTMRQCGFMSYHDYWLNLEKVITASRDEGSSLGDISSALKKQLGR